MKHEYDFTASDIEDLIPKARGVLYLIEADLGRLEKFQGQLGDLSTLKAMVSTVKAYVWGHSNKAALAFTYVAGKMTASWFSDYQHILMNHEAYVEMLNESKNKIFTLQTEININHVFSHGDMKYEEAFEVLFGHNY